MTYYHYTNYFPTTKVHDSGCRWRMQCDLYWCVCLCAQIVRMLIVVVVIFAICWLPQHVLLLVSSHNDEITKHPYIQHVYLAIYWLAMSNSMYNPIIYCLMNARWDIGSVRSQYAMCPRCNERRCRNSLILSFITSITPASD